MTSVLFIILAGFLCTIIYWLKAHGIVVTGKTIEEMTAGVWIMEDNAKRTAISTSMGKFQTLTEEEMAKIQPELMGDPGPIGRIWALCEAETSR